MTTEEFSATVRDWIAAAKHPATGRLFTDMVYQPMLELLAYLRANGFKTFIVSGGGGEFMRPWTERVYGIHRAGRRQQRQAETRGPQRHSGADQDARIDLIDDKEGKPVGIQRQIGRHHGYRTPNIDRIASDGAMFTDFYGQQSCTAGRAPSSPVSNRSAPGSPRSACLARRSA